MQPLKLTPYHVEILLSGNYLISSVLKPLGDLLVFLNDPNRSVLPLEQVRLYSLAPASQIAGLQQAQMTVNKHLIMAISIPDEEEASRVQVLAAKRRVVMYTRQFAIRGMLHVNEDAPDEDLLDDSRDFFVMSDAAVYSLLAVARPPTSPVASLVINRSQIQGYHRSS